MRPGDSLIRLLRSLGVAEPDIALALAAMRSRRDPSLIEIGERVEVAFESRQAGRIRRLRLADEEAALVVERRGDGFVARNARAGPRLLASYAAGAPAPKAVASAKRRLAGLLGGRADPIELVWEHPAGRSLGQVVYAAFAISGQRHEIWRFQRADGRIEWFDARGRSLTRAIKPNPLPQARISSPFGMRLHPILKRRLMHEGLDLAAPTGTPVPAAGTGVVVFAGRNGGYGRMVRLRHGPAWETLYAHLSQVEPWITPGVQVRAGDVIGRVGSTGRSTGPHLHYEVLFEGDPRDPLGEELPRGEPLTGRDLARFLVQKAEIDRLRSGRPSLLAGLSF